METGKITFARLCYEELLRTKERDSIGLLAEKRLHSVLKRWIVDDIACHEKKVPGRDGKLTRFEADILTPAGDIYEIQTGGLYPMRRKVAFYMEETDFRLTVVHPLMGQKWISWMDPVTGEVSTRKKSPLHETPLRALGELKPFLDYIGTPRFSYCLPLLEVDEYRLLDGWGRDKKRGSHRYELMPMALLDTFCLQKKEDYLALFPADASGEFTAKEFGKLTHLRGYDLYDVLFVFEGLGAIEKCGTKGRAALYRRLI